LLGHLFSCLLRQENHIREDHRNADHEKNGRRSNWVAMKDLKQAGNHTWVQEIWGIDLIGAILPETCSQSEALSFILSGYLQQVYTEWIVSYALIRAGRRTSGSPEHGDSVQGMS
jgi:hypothetical protein